MLLRASLVLILIFVGKMDIDTEMEGGRKERINKQVERRWADSANKDVEEKEEEDEK